MTAEPPVVLERRDETRNMARFYVISVEPTLFGQWAVVRHWGRLGTSGQARESWFADLDAARAESAGWQRRKRGRGYRSATVESADTPFFPV